MGSGLVTPGHIAVLLVVALLVFGPKRLPELGRSLGHGMRGFKDAISGEEEEQSAPAVGAAPAEPPAGPAPEREPAGRGPV